MWIQHENGVWTWGFSPSKYVKEATSNCKKYLEEKKFYRLHCLMPNLFPTDYRLELDRSVELLPENASYYQSLMGVCRWMIELGRVDISSEVSTLSMHMGLPCQGHLEAAFHIMAYLSSYHYSRLCQDPTYFTIDSTQFLVCDWRE